MKKTKTLLSLIGAGLIAGTSLLSGGCSTRKYVGNASAVKSTNYNEKSKYKESDLILGENRYVLKEMGENIIGIDFDNTQLNTSTKTRLWDYSNDFSFKQTKSVIPIGKFKQSRKLKKNKSREINEKDYKYNLKDFLTPIKIGGSKYLSMQKGDKLFLFKQGEIDVVLDEDTKEIYITNKQNREGVYFATVPEKQKQTYQLTPKDHKKINTQKFHTRTINKGDTFWDIAIEYKEKFPNKSIPEIVLLLQTQNPTFITGNLPQNKRMNIYPVVSK